MTSWCYGIADRHELMSRSGLGFLNAILDGELPAPPIAQTLDFAPVAFGPGHAVFEGRPDHRHLNPLGGVHGGYAATLLDSCMGCAVHTLLEAGEGFTTVELKVSFLRPITRDTGRVRAVGTALSRGRRMAFAEGRLHDDAGRLLAHATCSCMLLATRSGPTTAAPADE